MEHIIRIPNIADYNQTVTDGGELILTPRVIIDVTEDTVMEYALSPTKLTNSKIISCSISDPDGSRISVQITRYQPIVIDILKQWNETMTFNDIAKNTDYKFKSGDMKGDMGYRWCKDLNMSFQGKNSPGTFKEIVKMCEVARYSLDIKINLDDDDDTTIHVRIRC